MRPPLDFGMKSVLECWFKPAGIPRQVSVIQELQKLAADILQEVPGVVSVTYNIASKPPSTIEAI